jgi:hypothetical protein
MPEATVSPLLAWTNFYVIIGSAAAALTGLMFVVITLIAGSQMRRSSGAVAAFGTPNVMHFCAALFIAALLSAPWQALWQVGLLLGLSGLGGVTYAIIVFLRTRRQTDYKPVLEDWLWHVIFPFISYFLLTISAFMLPSDPVLALFGVGVVVVWLMFIGIHNAWDSVTYMIIERYQSENKRQE